MPKEIKQRQHISERLGARPAAAASTARKSIAERLGKQDTPASPPRSNIAARLGRNQTKNPLPAESARSQQTTHAQSSIHQFERHQLATNPSENRPQANQMPAARARSPVKRDARAENMDIFIHPKREVGIQVLRVNAVAVADPTLQSTFSKLTAQPAPILAGANPITHTGGIRSRGRGVISLWQ